MSDQQPKDLKPHEAVFVSLTERQSELLDQHADDPSIVLAAVIACGQWASGMIPEAHRERTAVMVADILERLARAALVLEATPKGEA